MQGSSSQGRGVQRGRFSSGGRGRGSSKQRTVAPPGWNPLGITTVKTSPILLRSSQSARGGARDKSAYSPMNRGSEVHDDVNNVTDLVVNFDCGGEANSEEEEVSETEMNNISIATCSLYFGECSTQPLPMESSPRRPESVQSMSDPSDVDRRGGNEDFDGKSSDTAPSSPASSFDEMPMSQLGLYNEDEDTSDWTFDETWADDQWQEPMLCLLGTSVFHGPPPGSTGRLRMVPESPFIIL